MRRGPRPIELPLGDIFVDVFFFFLTCPLKMRDGNSNY